MAGAIQWSWRPPFMLAAAPNFLLVPLFLLTVKEVGMGYSEPELRRLYEVGAEYGFQDQAKGLRSCSSGNTCPHIHLPAGDPRNLSMESDTVLGPNVLQEVGA